MPSRIELKKAQLQEALRLRFKGGVVSYYLGNPYDTAEEASQENLPPRGATTVYLKGTPIKVDDIVYQDSELKIPINTDSGKYRNVFTEGSSPVGYVIIYDKFGKVTSVVNF